LERFGGDRASFTATAADLVRSNLFRRPSGEVLALAEDRYAILLGPASVEEAAGLEGELRGAFDAYLGVEASLAVGPETATESGLAAAWREAENAFAIRSRIVVRARRRISEGYADATLDLADIAAYAGASKNHLSWEFSRETGETISACIARTRVEAAKQLLIGTNLKIYEVAERTGFSNVETFCRSFLKITGKQPSSWRTG
jgi:AraC-like DNA-binding protein